MKTVLLIEDDPEMRTLLGQFLNEQGWKVVEAEDGEAGIALARQHRPSVVLCDLLMPRCNGFQVIRTIRADKHLPRCRIIVISGRDYAIDRFNALEAGADHYLIKPVRPQEVLDLMDEPGKATLPSSTVEPPAADASPVSGTFIRFWGVRGSLPTPGAQTVFYGGNTTCVEVRADGEIIILDAGTGIRGLGLELVREFDGRPIRTNLLLTHTHWDHIQGLPFFAPLYGKGNRVRVMGFEGAREGLMTILSGQMESPYFPVGFKELPGTISVEELKDLSFQVGRIQVRSTFVNHPGICVGYRLNTSRGSIAFLPDNEPFSGSRHNPMANHSDAQASNYAAAQDDRLTKFLADVDHLIIDTQYDAEEYRTHRGWGHGNLDDVVAIALKARARNLYLFHHDPSHDDEHISRMVAHARQLVFTTGGTMKVEAAREGWHIPI